MKFTIAAAALAGVATAQSWGAWPASNGTVSYTTEVVTAYTTYCPSATSIVHGSSTYVVTSATTLTITDCPCTVTKPVWTSVVTSCSTSPVAKPTGTAPVGKPWTSGAPAAGTSTAASSPSTSPITPAKGAADKVSVGVAGVLAVAGLVAAL